MRPDRGHSGKGARARVVLLPRQRQHCFAVTDDIGDHADLFASSIQRRPLFDMQFDKARELRRVHIAADMMPQHAPRLRQRHPVSVEDRIRLGQRQQA